MYKKLYRLYLLFRIYKLYFISYIYGFIFNVLTYNMLKYIFIAKNMLQDDLNSVGLDNDFIYITNVYFNNIYYLLLRWKFNGLDISDINNFCGIEFIYKEKHYLLFIDKINNTYIYNNITDNKSEKFDILFNMIELNVNF